MARAFDYSKWDNIELSDDESDLHPNIDKDSWFRLKHRTRLEREEKEDLEIKSYEEEMAVQKARLAIINASLKKLDSGEKDDDEEEIDKEALVVEAEEIKQAIDQRVKRIQEIRERRKWNIDNICKVKEEKTIVNSAETKPLKPVIPDNDEAEDEPIATEKVETVFKTPDALGAKPAIVANPSEPQPAAKSKAKGAEPAAHFAREKLKVMNYNDYVISHENILETYSEIVDLEATKEYLFKHCDVLLHEHSQSYLLLSCLEDEMNGKHTRMKLVCRQSQILSHIQELGVSMKRDPRDVVLPFFQRITQKEYLAGFTSAVNDFIVRIQQRAVEKRKEMDAEKEDVHPTGPGGLDPMEVLQNLPTALREAFESQDIARLQEVLAGMDEKEAKDCMKKCVDSGLWVPKDSSIFEDDE